MARIPYFLLVTLLFLCSTGIIDKKRDTNVPVTKAKIEIDTVYDAAGIPDFYRAHITTPICEADKCYAVEIVFYWDLIGRFTDYDTIPGAGLTKLDHQPFHGQDYKKLLQILRDDYSILASYDKEELVHDKRISEIDGFTGATINEIKASVIEGAAYSCYTLWHIAHGPLSEKLKRTTYDMLDKALVKKMVNMKDQRINYFLIDHFSSGDFMIYMPEIFRSLDDREGYYAKRIV